MRFPGYRQLYEEMRDDDGKSEEDETDGLPELAVNDPLRLIEVKPEQHFTEPPPRYTEASLVKALEENGIGRPSTYAPILSTIQDRGYVKKDGRALVPQDLGFIVNDLLVEHFPDVFDVGFTAEMEEELDEVARGERPWEPVVRQFYEPLEAALESAKAAPKVVEETDEVCEKCGRPMLIRWGRFGKFLACTGFPECRNTKPLDQDEQEEPEATDETCDECGAPMVVKRGRYGKFLACSRYPECKGTKPLLTKVGVACPKCGGDIVERTTRKRRTFYGCSNYPECDFTSWSRPLPQPCPECGGLIVTAGRARKDGEQPARCTQCDWRGAVRERELAEAAIA
jgi:DNA topoisomerase-1